MDHRAGVRAVSVAGVLAMLLLAGCSTWWQQQRQVARQRLHQRCLDQKRRIGLVMQQISADQAALATLAAERYVPSAQPSAPDPRLAQRYSQLDREIDLERYNQQLEAWQRRERVALERWQQTQGERRTRVQQRLAQHTNQLANLGRRLVRRGRPDPAAIVKSSDCSATAP